ncbi:unnamed protein product [Cylicocyclus nassatus]|uniref:Uncharacterized protein n=1 Tax=Cylicocyclus nassatus TaxID=53992 RepID=A0AA36GC42_CYLNA|nr:unnamed protein product [Cylicocyclus nassatus]
MGASLTNAVVIKKMATPNSFLLIVNKSFVLGRFEHMPFVPAIGAVIVIDYRVCSDVRNIIIVVRWKAYTGDLPMSFRLLSRSKEEAKFWASFYTCGCVRYKTIPYSNPAVFNDIIGVVEDENGVLEKKYIGKLHATVKLSIVSTGHKWELCCVNDYLQQSTDLQENCSRGIVGAVNQKSKLSYITSREFPHDVRFNSGNVDADCVKDLLGREVTFVARQRNSHIYHVTGSVKPLTRSIIPIIHNEFFSLVVKVEHIGCKDEHGVGIVWSEKLEFIRDPYKLIEGCGKSTSIYERVHEIEESQSSNKASRPCIIPSSSLRT